MVDLLPAFWGGEKRTTTNGTKSSVYKFFKTGAGKKVYALDRKKKNRSHRHAEPHCKNREKTPLAAPRMKNRAKKKVAGGGEDDCE